MAIVAWDMRGVRSGPLFQNLTGGMIEMAQLDALMHQHLMEIQAQRPDLIAEDIVVMEEYSIHRSFRRGSTTQARNKGVSEADINTANQWRNHERAGGRRPGSTMMEHYSQIQMLVPTLVRYSRAL